MKRAVLKRLTAFIASILVVTIASPNFVYSVKASAHEGEAGIAIEASAPEETEAEKAKAPKTESDKKPAKETKKAAEAKAEPEETKAKETEAKEPEAKAEEPKATEAKSSETKSTEAKATEAKSSEKAEETKATEPEQSKESEKETPAETKASETEQTKETAEDSKETAPSESAVETEPTETAEPSESKETEETQPSESEPAETSESSESSEETEPSETSESTAAETAPAANIKVAESAEEFISIVASLPASYRLIIDTDKDLSSLKGAKGVYYDGSYVLVFDGINNYDAALKYLSGKNISYSIDGSVELCGGKFIVNDVKINPNAKTKIAIIDTGSSLANEKISVMGDKGDDKNGHGTAMASKVLEQTSDAYIISIKAIDDDGTGKVADVYAALQYAIEADCKVVLMAISLRDLGQYEAFKSLIADAISKDIKIVASAGNNGTDASKYIPAGLKGVLTAGAMDENGVKLPKSNYGKSVEYYVVAESTSEAAAVLAGKVIAGREDELATTCKMSASEGKDDTIKRFKINDLTDFALSNSAEDLYNAANAFCIFTKTYTHSNHMEGTVAADKLVRNVNDVMDLSHDLIYANARKGNFYFYFNDIDIDSATKENVNRESLIKKELLNQNRSENAPFYIGPDLVYVKPEKTDDDKSQITVDGNVIKLDKDYSNNGNGYVIYSKRSHKIEGVSDHETTMTAGGQVVMTSNKIDFDSVLLKIGDWSDKFYNKHDLKVTDGELKGITYEIKLHDGVNYINITEEQFNDYGFDFIPSDGQCSIVINVIDSNGDGVVRVSHSESNKRISFNGVGSPDKNSTTLSAATHILLNFKSNIHTVDLGESTTAQLGTILAPGASVRIGSTHDGNVISNSFENEGVEIHQSGFPFTGKNASSSGKVTINKIFEHSGNEPLDAKFTIYEGNYRSVSDLSDATGKEMTKSGSTFSASMTVAGPYTIRETKTPANYDGLGDTLIHISLKSDGSVVLDAPKSATNIFVNSSSTAKNLTLDVTNTRKKSTNPGEVEVTKNFDWLFGETASATFTLYYGTYGSLAEINAAGVTGIDSKTINTHGGKQSFTGLNEVGPYTIVETVTSNYKAVGLIHLELKQDGKVKIDPITDVQVTVNDNTQAKITVTNHRAYDYEVSISKQDMTNKGTELPGAKMKLTVNGVFVGNLNNVRVSGPEVTVSANSITWTSTNEPLVLRLPNGNFTLEETAELIINGSIYNKFTTSIFTIANGKVTEDNATINDDTVTFTGTDNRTVTAFNTPKTYEVSISKQDMMNKGPELPGASMKLTAATGTTVDWSKARVSGPAISANGQSITWTSTDAPLKINLPDGTYTLEETATLKIGDKEYETITTSTFTMKDGKVTEKTDTSSDDTVTFTGTDGRTVTAFDTPKTTPVKTYEVSISKQDMMNKGPELPGASMKLTSKDDVDWDNVHVSGPAVTGNGKELTWTSGDEPLKINLPDGTYTLEETATLKIGDKEYETITTSTFVMKDGKVTEQTDTSSDDTVTFTGTDGRTVTAFDKPVTKTYEVSISKQDMMNKGPELPGASMKLTAATGTTVDWSKARVSGPAISANGQSITWTSADSPLKINLPDGTYTLEETATLKIGDKEYETITTSTFVMKDGKVTEQTDTSFDDTVTFTGTDGRTVTAFDTPKTTPVGTYEVSISKKDIADQGKDNAEELPGAKMKITATGTTVVDWSNAHVSGPAITANGKSITWTSGSSPLKVNLPNGTYVLEENGAPAGYLEITATNFEVKDGKVVPGSTTSSTVAINGNTNTITAFDELRLTETVFSKKDFAKKTDSGAEELEGALMKLTALSGPASEWNDSDWDAARKSGPTIRKILNEDAINWTSGTSQLKLALPDGEYELIEQTPPSDYQTITKLTFKIEKGEITGTTDETTAIDNDNKVITAFDKAEGAPAEVYISKKDMADKGVDNANELVGAEMQLTAINGKAVDWDEDTWKAAKKEGPEVSKVAGQRAIKWTSSTTQLKIALPDGKYELKETGTPAGYNVISTTTFEISGGKVQPLTTETVVADENTNTITAFDSAKTYKVQLSKEDIAHNQVASATLSVTSMDGHDLTNVKVSRNGTAVDTTLSSDKHTISFVTGGNTYSEITGLRMGKYQLKETVTPEKYLTADAITFEIKDDGSLYINSVKVTGSMVVMIDRADPAYFTPVTINGLDKEDRSDVPDIEITIKSKTPTVDLTGVTPTGGDVTDQGEKTITIKTKGGPVELSLPDGEYTITPKGPSKYDNVPSTPFKVEGGKVVPTGTPGDIEITDHNITILLPKSNPGKKTSKGSVPATGVGISAANVAGAVLVSAALTAMGICIVVFKKKKKEY